MRLTLLSRARSGAVLGAAVAAVLATSALPAGAMHPGGHGDGSVQSRIDDVLEGAYRQPSKGKSTIYVKPGGWRQANADFDHLRGSHRYRWRGHNTRVASLPDGTYVTRYRSSGGDESISVNRPGRRRTVKIRYP